MTEMRRFSQRESSVYCFFTMCYSVSVSEPCQVGGDLDTRSPSTRCRRVSEPCQVGGDLDTFMKKLQMVRVSEPCQVGGDLA